MFSTIRLQHYLALSTLTISLLLLLICQSQLVLAVQQLPPNFFNQSGCLYVTTTDASHYRVTFPEGYEPQTGPLGHLSYESSSACINGDKPGLLVMKYEPNDNNFLSMTLELTIRNNMKTYNWDITRAKLDIVPNNKQLFPYTELFLNPASGGEIYAPLDRSYSCSSLLFTNTTRNGPVFKITLKRFQLQPFPEPQTRIFAMSRDCSSWLTLPQIMGFLLILFIIFTVLIGAYLLIELGGHSSDLRFSKQGGMLMNQAQLDATKAD